MNDTVQSQWEKLERKQLQSPKFLRIGSKVIVNCKIIPKEVTVDGRYGPRKMYIIDTTDYGLIYVNPIQFLRIAEIVERAKYENVTVEL